MNKEIIEHLEKNKYLQERLSEIEKLIEKNDYKEAYYKSATMLEYINIEYIKTKFNIDMKNSSVINILNTYLGRDEILSKDMSIVNSEYNDVDINNVELMDIEYLIGIIDAMYQHMVETVGEFIK